MTLCMETHGLGGEPLGVVRYHNMTCTQAKEAISQGTFRNQKFTTPGFQCSTHPFFFAGGDITLHSFICTAGRRSFKFSQYS
jgi:hypothetical protein